MNLKLHNKVEVVAGDKKLCFYNTMLKSVQQKFQNRQSFNEFLAIGTGTGEHSADNYKLLSHLKTFPLELEFLQDDVSVSEDDLYVKKSVLIDDDSLVGKNITEVGLTDELSDNPTIYNYISLVSEESPNGFLIEKSCPILISVYIYLTLSKTGEGVMCAGKNKLIDFLLGCGLSENLYACRGLNLLQNQETVERVFGNNAQLTKFPCSIDYVTHEAGISLCFSANLKSEKTYEVVILVGDSPVARINVLEHKSLIASSETFSPKRNYVIDAGNDVKSVNEVINLQTNEMESDIYISKYADRFGDKIKLPFDGLFSNDTPRFLSKDGKMIFFVYEDRVYGYKNISYKVVKLNTSQVNVSNIISITSFDDFVFIFSRSHPYVFCYKIIADELVFAQIDIQSFEKNYLLERAYKIDMTLAKNGNFILAFLDDENHFGYVAYYTFDENQNKFVFDSYFESNYNFTYLLAMIKNNFSDACIIFLKEAESPYETRLVYYYADKTYRDIYTTLAVEFTENTKEIYAKNRAIIIEKTTEPHIWVYYYPQLYRYTLSLFGSEENDYISTNLHYLIQKYSGDNYKIFNLIGYDTPTEFLDGFNDIVDQGKILDFEFLDDTLLIFLDSIDEPVVAFNLFENHAVIENVSSNENQYRVVCDKYDLIGKNSEEVIVSLTIKINVWFFLKDFISFLLA